MRYLSDTDGIAAMIMQLSRRSRGDYSYLPEQIHNASHYHSHTELARGEVRYNGTWYHYNSSTDTLTIDSAEQPRHATPDPCNADSQQQLAMF